MELTKVIRKLDKNDVALCKAFKSIVLEGKFEVQGKALAQVGALFRWIDDLDKRIEETIKAPPPETIRKSLEPSEEPVKKESKKQKSE